MNEALVVDDDPVSRLVVRHMLERAGLVVVDADGVDPALLLLAERRRQGSEPFSLIVCDYDMPGRSGMDLLHEHDGDEPFVLLTGNEISVPGGSAERFFAHATKPISSDELNGLVDRALARS